MEEFIDKIKRGIDKGVNVVNVKSKEFLDAIKIQSQMEELKLEKRRALEEAGQTVYRMYVEPGYNGDAEIRQKCAAIEALDLKIKSKEDELRQIRVEASNALGKTICSCGARLDEDDKFCRQCGARNIRVE